MGRKVILFELNEVPARVLDRYCLTFPNSSLAELRRHSREYETFAEDTGALSPWITWPTLHRGVTNVKHTITHLGQDIDEINQAYPPIWDVLVKHDVTVGVGGSLHSFPLPPDRRNFSFYLPDTFAWESAAFPEAVEAFQAFNLAMVGRSARNVDTSLGLADASRLLRHVGGLGISPGTLLRMGGQVVSERLHKARKARRRTSQATLAFDVVMRQIETTQPVFATFFTNHVASAMHRFWAASFPGDFASLAYDKTWIETFSGEIDHGMVEADRFARRLLSFVKAHPDYLLIIATSMGQGPHGGHTITNELMITDPGKFMQAFGVPAGRWRRRPAMIPQYVFEIDDEFRPAFLGKLRQVSLGARPGQFNVDDETGKTVTLTIATYNFESKSGKVLIGNRAVDFDELGMEVMETDFQQASTGYHIPEGVLLAFDPQRPRAERASQQASTCEIAPSILTFLGVMPPPHMLSGRLFV